MAYAIATVLGMLAPCPSALAWKPRCLTRAFTFFAREKPVGASSPKEALPPQPRVNALARAGDGLGSALRPATRAEYEAWLGDFLARGGRTTESRSHAFGASPEPIYLAVKDYRGNGLFELDGMSILVPPGKVVAPGAHAEANLLGWGDPSRAIAVPRFADTPPDSELISRVVAQQRKRFEAKMRDAGLSLSQPKGREVLERMVSMGFLRQATPEEYRRWLSGYVKRGGTIASSYEYRMPSQSFYVPLKDLYVPESYGSKSFTLIVPKGRIYLHPTGKLGHNRVLLEDGYQVLGSQHVGTYLDTTP
jgi:hypothetical protein